MCDFLSHLMMRPMDHQKRRYRLYYDDDDYQLLEMVNKLLSHHRNSANLRRLFDPGLHPGGVKELAAPRPLRIASAMIDLLGTLEYGTAGERLTALRVVRAESLHDSSRSLRVNAARVLLQIMKEIVRASGDMRKQLGLAHDFREASSGKPRLIRKQLRNYHLLEMPEAWNQIAFDHHVHDANTKGRKSPTHLIMDAWIKGIRFLGVIYYNEVRPEVAAELLEAADIMGIDVRIGVEVKARLRDKYIQLIWSPRGFLGREDFLRFWEEPDVRSFLAEGQAVLDYEKQRILELLHSFNDNHLPVINGAFGVDVPPLDEDAFLAAVGCGQASLVHLAEYVHRTILPFLEQRINEVLAADHGQDRHSASAPLHDLVASYRRFVPETLVEAYLRPEMNPSVPDPRVPTDGDDIPLMLRLDTAAMIQKIEALPCRSRITLNPSNLSPADVLEVIYEGRGRITHMEIYNAKDWAQGRTTHRVRINDIRLIINRGNVMEAKRLVREILSSLEQESTDAALEGKIRAILADLRTLLDFYKVSRLRSRLGSDSIGHSTQGRGMGFVVVPSLPWRARREIRKDPGRMVPVTTVVKRHVMAIKSGRPSNRRLQAGRDLSNKVFLHAPSSREVTWSLGHNSTTLADSGNVASLGGRIAEQVNDASFLPALHRPEERGGPRLRHLNSFLRNASKVLLGFLPAFLTFYLTKDWWVLVYFGAVIWFGITGLRNVLQSVIGGGGFRRSSLLHWKDLVSWERVTESLMFTGFSVPLLDFLVKDLVLAGRFQITTTTAPVLLYSVMAVVNGVYLSSHNIYRGLPMGAVLGNFFRTILSIPVAVGLNHLILHAAASAGVPTTTALSNIQLFAAIISKTASDIVAAVIEGTADRQQNLSRRRLDYEEKLSQAFDVYARLETTYPEQDVLALFEHPKSLFFELEQKNNTLFRDIVIDSLDLLYFWWYQPRAQTALAHQVSQMSSDEVRFFVGAQQVLRRKRIVSKMLLDGLVGKRFESALSFYLSHSDRYLHALEKLAGKSVS